MRQILKKVFAGSLIAVGMILAIGSVGTMEVNSYLGKADKPIEMELCIVGTVMFVFGSYYAHVLSERLKRYGRC